MLIGGFQKFSLIDYPGKICAIIFTQGCNFRCPYCHNPELVNVTEKPLDVWEILSFLETRKGKLDAVEITGGEPTLHKDLIDFIRKIKDMGFLLKLDSNGTNPNVLRALLNEGLVDYIAMDVKAPLEKYKDVVRANVDISKIKESIDLIKNNAPDYEFRTTIVKSLLSKGDIEEIAKTIEGSKIYVLQKFISSKTLDPEFIHEETYSDEELDKLSKKLEKYVAKCIVR